MRGSQLEPIAASARSSAGRTPPYSRSTPRCLEDHHAVLDRVDREARVLETLQDLFPLPLDRGGIPVDENERRTGGERLPQSHPRLDACCLGCGGHRAEQRLLIRVRRERSRHEREPGPRAQCRSQLEPGNEETRDHRNICSIRTYVLLSRILWYFRPMSEWDWTRVVFDHVKVTVRDPSASIAFYKTVLAATRDTAALGERSGRPVREPRGLGRRASERPHPHGLRRGLARAG